MKSIKNMINEARQIEYKVSMIDVLDNEDLPITVTMVVDKEYQRSFEDWLEDQQDNLFSHAEGGSIEY
jgi:hypothetical protein